MNLTRSFLSAALISLADAIEPAPEIQPMPIGLGVIGGLAITVLALYALGEARRPITVDLDGTDAPTSLHFALNAFRREIGLNPHEGLRGEINKLRREVNGLLDDKMSAILGDKPQAAAS